MAKADGAGRDKVEVGGTFEDDTGPAPEADLREPAVDSQGPASPQLVGWLAVRPGAVLRVDEPGNSLIARRPRAEQLPAGPRSEQEDGAGGKQRHKSAHEPT